MDNALGGSAELDSSPERRRVSTVVMAIASISSVAISHRGAIAAQQPHGPIAAAVPGHRNRLFSGIPAQVVGKGSDRRITFVWLLAKGLQQNVVERSAQALPKQIERAVARAADRLRCNRRDRPILERRFPDLRNHRARPLRVLVADDPCDFLGRPADEPVWTMARQQLVEQQSQRVHIGCGRHGLAANLLRARVVRRHRASERRDGGGALGDGIENRGDPEVEQLRVTVV